MRRSKYLVPFAVILGALLIFGAGAMLVGNPGEGIRLESFTITQAPSGIRIFNGTMENRSGNLASDLRIDIEFFAADGDEPIESDFAILEQLPEQEPWQFGMRVPTNATRFRVAKIQGHDEARDENFSHEETRIRSLAEERN